MSRTLKRTYDAGQGARAVKVAEHAGGLRAWVDGEPVPFRARRVRTLEGGAELVIGTDLGVERAVVVREGDTVFVHLHGRVHRLRVVTHRDDARPGPEDAGDGFAASPMTGVVMKVLVGPGDAVSSGDALFMVEAMKMEYVVEAPRDVVIDAVQASPGDTVDIGQVVVTFHDPEGDSAK